MEGFVGSSSSLGPLKAGFLGMVQGLTEFLPISSSGHLVLFQRLFGFEEPELFFDISLHVGTLAAIVLLFFPQVRRLVPAFLRIVACGPKVRRIRDLAREDEDVRTALLICAGCVPTALLGLAFHKAAHYIFASVPVVGAGLLVTGALLWGTRRVRGRVLSQGQMKARHALWIGLVQGLAIVPGVSRSGVTIAMGLFLGLERETAARYSFLLSLPAVMGALLLELVGGREQAPSALGLSILGGIIAAVVGYGALRVLLGVVRRGSLFWFAPYCWVLGVGVLVLQWT